MKPRQIDINDIEGFTFHHEVAGYCDSSAGKLERKFLIAFVCDAVVSYGVVYNGRPILRNATLAKAVEAYNEI